ncbi:DNA polymerase subunit gamma-1 isoform X1 [Macrobrachium rosenbergii]|uniref:DNA polymerase subunit gamma-1 isoform X1 n=1 Tax=Macrobrachium rosenbergii TaxID=79674 RepID=UPI0034D4F1A6
MALRFPARYFSLYRIRKNQGHSVCVVVDAYSCASMCWYSSKNTLKISGKGSISKDLRISDEQDSHNSETHALWENLDSSDYSSFAEKYRENSESKDIESNDIQVVPVNEVLKDLLTERGFNTNSRISEVSPSSFDQDKRTKPKELADTHTNNLKTIKFRSKYPFTKSKTSNIIANRRKIILLEKDENVNFTKIANDRGKKNFTRTGSFHKGTTRGTSSKNIYGALKEMNLSKHNNSSHTLDVSTKEIFVEESKLRRNCLGIQMLSSSLFNQIFGKIPPKQPREQQEDFLRSKMHLEDQSLWGKEPSVLPESDFRIPSIEGSNLEEHFCYIAEEQCKPYKELLNKLIQGTLPSFPDHWQFTPGWTQYKSDGTFSSVDFPTCHALVFDVEVCVKEGGHPTLATAVSDKHWYSWCSDYLISNCEKSGEVTVDDLIPLESSHNFRTKLRDDKNECAPRVVVGHNVSFDRLRVREQYQLKSSSLRFVDTMSLHIAVSGLVSEQRALIMKNKASETKIRLPWMSVGCQNNLSDVYKFYCKDDLTKDPRDVFVKGTLLDVRNDFQNLMSYCANDVKATLLVLKNLLPLFFKRFPHPVTFSGMLEMGSAFLPVSENWKKYVNAAEGKYHELERLLNEELVRQAQESLAFRENDRYKRDPWLWNLDWSTPKGRVKTLPGYPNWYRKLCAQTGERGGTPEPENMSTSLQIVPKILKLTWEGFPLHYERRYGWGYLKPLFENYSQFQSSHSTSHEVPQAKEQNKVEFPIDVLYEICSDKNNVRTITLDEVIQDREKRRLGSPETEEDWQLLLGESNSSDKDKRGRQSTSKNQNSEGTSYDIGIPGVVFVPLPHKDGPGNRVGNPLAKDFLNKIEDNTLSSYHGDIAKAVLETNKMLSYWKNNRDRILSQLVVWDSKQETEDCDSASDEVSTKQTGIILPLVVTAGTITRRAVERTWMTASNAYSDRIGSELKAMIEAPPGYKFVGADVDSQELWIAAVLGDAYFSSEHGSTAFGWMTLQGKKSDGSDMHSRTAEMAGISRDHAKVINYGRIYGAGVKFIQRLLKQFNHKLSDEDAQKRATSLFEATKGKKGWLLSDKGEELAAEILYPYNGEAMSRKEVNALLRKAEQCGIEATFDEVVEGSPVWVGGSESHMFNCLEAVARSDTPRTPALGARITRALEPKFIDDQFMTSRVNWVVQSSVFIVSAVDYLHLMIVSMKWLFKKYNITGRFCISIHDEVRYMVSEEDCYRAALALQITNLLTRSLFAIRLGFKDLPQSVAFFSSVDIDQVLRKEPHLDCVTPSNPDGLWKGYGIPPGESLDIERILEITQGRLNKTD